MQYEQQSFLRCAVLLFRLILPLFLLCYPLALALQALLPICFLTCTPFDVSTIGLTALIPTAQATVLGIVCGVASGLLGNVGLGIVVSMALGATGAIVGHIEVSFTRGIMVAIALGIIGGTGKGLQLRMRGGVAGSIVGGIVWTVASSFANGTIRSVVGGFLIIAVSLMSYALGYYRLLLYPVSSCSTIRLYYLSKKNPLRVFANMHNSSLYWDECDFLPLPALRRTLLIAAEQDVPSSLNEIAFIIDERPQQRFAALATLVEIALRDMQMRESIREIARATQRLSELLLREASLIDPRWVTPFTRLSDASREAARYCGPLSWQTRRDALEKMLAHLEKIYPSTAFPDLKFNALLEKIVSTWRAAARYEQEKLEQGSESMGQIDNPYNPGQVLKPHDTLFVGRRDVVRQLSESLSRENHPTFLLNGERRMGKSSTLKQLPNLLGASYLPIIYDLQARGISSSVDALLGKLAEEIYKVVSLRGINVKKLERVHLREALQSNEAAAYYLFDEWLNDLERGLEPEGCTVFLLFDEFEKLEEAGASGYLHLNLLLDWFRSTVQNRSHVALLFSGVRTFGEMGANWAAYFVNAKTLKLSFLLSAEARHLILHPIPNFPGQKIFPEEVVEEIIRVTGGHPFLLQAVCSELIESLNAENREQARIEDVSLAVTYVLDNWWDTYFRDLWERSDQEQRICLAALAIGERNDHLVITQKSGLAEQTVRYTLRTLLRRDLILLEKDTYRIASPIFRMWIERSV
jgi:uncharacterized protein